MKLEFYVSFPSIRLSQHRFFLSMWAIFCLYDVLRGMCFRLCVNVHSVSCVSCRVLCRVSCVLCHTCKLSYVGVMWFLDIYRHARYMCSMKDFHVSMNVNLSLIHFSCDITDTNHHIMPHHHTLHHTTRLILPLHTK